MTENIAGKIGHLIRKQFDIEEARLTPRPTLIEDLGANSLGLVELSFALSEEFDIDHSDEDAERIRTVQDVIRFIESTTEQGSTPRSPAS